MIMNGLKSLLVAVGLGVALSCNAQSIAEELSARLDKMGTFDANFVQHVINESGQPVKGSSGTIHVGKNRRFLVEVIQPDPIKIVSDGTTMWTYDVGLQQVSKQNVKAALKGSVAHFILYTTPQSLKAYNIGKYTQGDARVNVYELTPKVTTSESNTIRIFFEGDTLVGAQFEDMVPNAIEINFSNMKKPSRIAASEFHFVPPPHVDVVEDQL